MADKPLHALEYASPTTPKQPFRFRSRHVAYVTGTSAVLAAVFIPDTVGSGVVRVNPFAALACFAIMGGAIIYIWMRLFEEAPRSEGKSVSDHILSAERNDLTPRFSRQLNGEGRRPGNLGEFRGDAGSRTACTFRDVWKNVPTPIHFEKNELTPIYFSVRPKLSIARIVRAEAARSQIHNIVRLGSR